jgi:hypothetical protein
VRRDREKFDRMLIFGAKLPTVRRSWRDELGAADLEAP